MPNNHGGSRTPSNPAPVSGPGALSQRTDGQQPVRPVTGMPYGENADINDLQSSAPMAAASATPNTPQGTAAPSGMGSVAPPPGLFAPTERPNEPLTEGNPLGPGAGPATKPSFASEASADMQKLKEFLPDLLVASQFKDAPQTFRMLVNYLRNS